RKAPLPKPDFAGLGVPVDPKGRIIPLIQPESGPVLQNSSRMEIDYTPPSVNVPYNIYGAPYAYRPILTPWGPRMQPLYMPAYSGIMNVPLGLPRYFSSDSENPQSQDAQYQFSGSYYNGFPSASVWSPGWRSPFRGGLYIPSTTEFQNTGKIQSFFPKNMDD
ncbi:MAG: hypothetical protein K2X27_05950, partial [Candidatus Obscuribacterales bacterium]|nr:hypothetical protein [Candidatus Obscuribacterales bacterium]